MGNVTSSLIGWGRSHVTWDTKKPKPAIVHWTPFQFDPFVLPPNHWDPVSVLSQSPTVNNFYEKIILTSAQISWWQAARTSAFSRTAPSQVWVPYITRPTMEAIIRRFSGVLSHAILRDMTRFRLRAPATLVNLGHCSWVAGLPV